MQFGMVGIGRMGQGLVLRAMEDGHEAVAYDVNREPVEDCLLYTSPSPRDATLSRMPSSA